MNVLGISGSLRQGSYNTALLRAATELAPDGMTIEEFDLSPIPFYNDDVRLQGFPPSVEDLRTKIRRADALLFVTPEYNRSIPGVLKNAVDWASRAPNQPFDDKPVAIMGASQSILGTAFANHHLRQILVYLNAQMLNGPEVLVGGAAARFDERGRLTDEATRNVVAGHLSGLKRLALRLKG
ncbi:NAD(P)H-dependent oxidoreductase [Azospirillum sp. TSO35-2]|uniref:NADPH-dependent FMN reductase n=1 Tax=Azospirillum sp. TSO35-2 TaxID=716796 RepID=UPI000D61396A|nr:NAD(P)H-dependent oxidoreductase [Azospirillum sp. TSO35-2]PWC32890.1 NADPH-dependent FMN reductase [Azospirillum sp. TSO35-2]